MQLKARERGLLGVLLLVVCGVAVWNLALDSLWSRYLQATEAVRVLGEKLEGAKTAFARTDQLAREKRELQEALTKVALNQASDPGAQAVRHLADVARDLNLTMSEIKPGATRKVGTFHVTPLTVKGEGSYFAVMALLSRIYTELPAYEVTRLQLTRKTQDPGCVDFSLAVIVYRYSGAEGTR